MMQYRPFAIAFQGVQERFDLLEFEGEEVMGRPYHFRLKLLTDNAKLDLNTLIFKEATFTFNALFEGAPERQINGVCIEAAATGRASGRYRVEVVIAPKLWKLGLTRSSRVFLDLSVTDIIEKIFRLNRFTGSDYRFDLKKEYKPLEFVCQYNESDLDFIQRWAEEYGIAFYFEQGDGKETVVFSDDSSTFSPLKNETCEYAEMDKQMLSNNDRNIASLAYVYRPVASGFKHKNHDPKFAHSQMDKEGSLSPKGSGTVELYGGSAQVQESFSDYAAVETQRLGMGGKTLDGKGNVNAFAPGALFKVKDHYSIEASERFLLMDVTHRGRQAVYLNDGLAGSEPGDTTLYDNTFTAMPNSKQYRPQRTTPRPEMAGYIIATIDSDDETTPQMDSYGRYKVVLPFDTVSKEPGKGSCWIRMAQPSAADGSRGFQIGLYKGDQVLLGFVEGDIDRPVIVGAINPREAVVGENNSYQDVLRTKSGHQIVFDNTPGSEHILISSINGGVTMKMS